MATVRKRGERWQVIVQVRRPDGTRTSNAATFDTEGEARLHAHRLEYAVRSGGLEMLLTPEQRRVLRSDLAEMRRRRLAAVDAAAYWPAPFDRIQAPDSRPWPDIDGEVVDPTP